MEEMWKPIKDFEDLYEISNLGRIKSLEKSRNYKNTTRLVRSKILNSANCQGYRILTLSRDSKKVNYRVHRLVCEAFIPNPKNKPYVNHIDENKSNNVVTNLEWVTAKENINHSILISGKKTNKGKTWENHKFSFNQCLEMVNHFKNGLNVRKISIKFDSNSNTISKIIKNEKYNN